MSTSYEEELEELITPAELERIAKLPQGTQAALRSRREIPFIMVGKRTPRYRKSAILEWLAARSVPATEDR